ncbi:MULTISPECIES: AMP-dependent synthetase/ligase [unclassified Nocardioides]|uniref:AMP-dependent synthetase/ligase n=1 Tax=unclassified Nocardioides TaxID=2615069 RepID=UPI000703728B|nr:MULTISPECIES: long-chain fatty acid--CoA ligase [unclassified Nocardioides]KRC59825.1 AMP-dependent synthetase [Nocardioides sp. Root79]KRC68715.1 AMP-dependent synthetase [Nocardioides sp. Root240]
MNDAPPTPLSAGTVPEAFQRTVAQHGDKVALRNIDGSVSLTWSELDARVRSIAAGLAAAGLGKGDTIAMLLPNTPECHQVDFAAVHLGAIPFAIFNSSPAEQIAHQLSNADARFVVTEQAFLPKVLEAASQLDGQIETVIVVDGEAEGTTSLAAVEAGADASFDFDAAWRAVTPDDLVTLIYTSGTTGPPKGAQWSHRTVMAEQRALDAALPLPVDGIISFLPMAHAGGRITAHYMSLGYGATITACPDMKEVPVALATSRPDAFFSVPRLWEKLQVAIEAMIAGQPDEQRVALQEVVDLGLERVRAVEAGSGVPADEAAALVERHDAILDRITPLLARLGLDNIKAAFVGGAPSSPELSQFFRAVGVPMLEAYGLTEGSLNVFNRVEDYKTGTAGKPLPGVEVKLAEDGELLCRAELNFSGYRKQPEATAEALDADGWLHTGDIATIDEHGFIKIVDRKKEIIITSAGKNMSPANIESAVRGESSLVGQVVAIGDARSYVTALITLDPEAAPVHAKNLGLEGLSLEELVASPVLLAEVEGIVDRANKRLHGNEQIKKFTVLGSAWLPDTDELTPTAKLKRRVIHVKYADEIEGMYA